MAFVTAVAVATGEKQDVPEEWLDLSDAGVPGFNFKLPPSARAREAAPVNAVADTTDKAAEAATPKEN